ncbi:FHA domain-containing protein [Streptomyces sp. NPDC054841]
MQIRLTVLAPRSGQSVTAASAAQAGGRVCDVLVTAPAGTALAAVASGLAAAVSGPDAPSGTVVLYAGRERLDAQRCALGEPPLVDGAVLSLQVPGEDETADDDGGGAHAQLHVVAGPDAGGVHLLHGGRIRVGRSVQADVPLDDPDVSRLHCEVTVADDGRVTVADLGSTNGTALDGVEVGPRPVRLAPGALLRLGESTLRLTAPTGGASRLSTTPDGEGHLRVRRGGSGTGAHGDPAPAEPGSPDHGRARPADRIPSWARRRDADAPEASGPDGGDRVSAQRAPSEPGGRPAGGGPSWTTTGRPGGAAQGPPSESGDDGTPSHGRAGAYGHDTRTRDPRPAAPGGGTETYGPEVRGGHAPGSGTGTGMGSGGAGQWAAPGSRGSSAGYGQAPGSGATPHGGTRTGAATGDTAHGAGHLAAPGRHDGTAGGGRGTGHTRAGSADAAGGDVTHGAGHRMDAGRHGDAHDDAVGGGAGHGGPRADGARPAGGDATHGGGTDDRTGTNRSGTGRGGTGRGGTSAYDTGQASRAADGTGRGGTDAYGTGQARTGRGGTSAYGTGRGGTAADGTGQAGTDAYDTGRGGTAADATGHGEVRADRDGSGSSGAGAGRRTRGDGGARRRGIGAWARRLAGAREEAHDEGAADAEPMAAATAPVVETWPDPAAVLLTALGPGPRLWERGTGHPEALVVRLGTADRADTPAVPVTVGLREAGSLGLAGPRARLAGLARSVVAQLAALHSPADLEIVLISTDRARPLEERKREWGWLGWLPHLRPAHGQDCRLLVAYEKDQATARAAELTRRLDDGPLGPGWPSAERRAVEEAAAGYAGPRTLVILDGDPGSAALRETTARLAGAGAAGGIHVLCLAETPAASPLSPVAATYEEACAASLAFRECGAVALLSGDVATALRLLRTAAGQPAGHGTVAAVDAVSAAWAERFGRALAPLRADADGASAAGRAITAPLPRSARLLDELGLARATPASLMARWASATDGTAVLGAGPRGPVAVDLTAEGPHLLIEGPAGSGRTELLRSIAASLAAAGRPDRLGLLLVDGAGGERGEGLAALTELPHVTEHLVASDPVRMREFAQALGAELKRRSELLGRESFTEWHTRREVSERLVGQRPPSPAESRGDPDPSAGGTLRLRPAGARTKAEAPPPLPRLVVLADDYDALVAPALGSPGRPAAGSVVRALDAVARDGERLGVHLVATSARPDRTADTELTHGARLRVVLDAPPVAPGPEDPAPGRGRLGHPDGRVTPFQGGRVTGRIPRTATQRPTVVELEWERMGDPPARRPVRELGNGPTDLALLASALDRAARSVEATPLPPLTPARS